MEIHNFKGVMNMTWMCRNIKDQENNEGLIKATSGLNKPSPFHSSAPQ